MSHAKSITAAELNKVARQAAESVLGDNMKRFGKDVSIGAFPDIGTIGIIWRDPDFENLNARGLYADATDIAGTIAETVGEVRPIVSIYNGGMIMGYFPSDPIITDKLF